MNIFPAALRRIPEDTRGLLYSFLYAGAAAGSAVAFLWLTNLLFHVTIEKLATLSPIAFILGSLGVIGATSISAGLLMSKVSPDSEGSGVPRLKAAYWKDLGFISFRSVIVKFVAGILTLGGGTSLGREGPSVYVGGGVASSLSAALGVSKQNRRPPAAAGAAASLAAAFNTPLAAITFVLEEMLNNDFGSRVLGGVVLAAVTGALTVHAFLGPQPAFALPSAENISWLMYLILPLVATVASLIGVAFQRCTLALRACVRDRERIPVWLRPLFGALITWVLGCAAFLGTGHTGVFGLGYNDLTLALNDKLVWQVAGILVVAKFVATVSSYGWGGCGGIFSPTLFMGGLTGFFLAGVAGIWLPLTNSDRIVLAAVGMSACFNSVVRAPLTSLLIVFEMTHQFSMVPALMFCSIVSRAMAGLGGRHNFYDALLLQDGHELIRIKPPRDLESWQKVRVSEIARTRPIVLPDLEPSTIRSYLESYPYQSFPVAVGGEIRGTLGRRDLKSALSGGSVPVPIPAIFCGADLTMREVGSLLVESQSGMVLVRDQAGSLMTVMTLHDLLRAQAAISE